jgi:hypothetical protein
VNCYPFIEAERPATITSPGLVSCSRYPAPPTTPIGPTPDRAMPDVTSSPGAANHLRPHLGSWLYLAAVIELASRRVVD